MTPPTLDSGETYEDRIRRMTVTPELDNWSRKHESEIAALADDDEDYVRELLRLKRATLAAEYAAKVAPPMPGDEDDRGTVDGEE